MSIRKRDTLGISIITLAALVGCSVTNIMQGLTENRLNGPIKGNIDKCYTLSDMKVCLYASLEGDMVVDYSTNEITKFPAKSFFKISSLSDSGNSHRFIIDSSSSGTFSKSYFENGVRKEFHDNAKVWWKKISPSIYRETGFDFRRRLNFVVSETSIQSAISEIRLIQSDMVASLYMRELMTNYALSLKEFETLLLISERIGSDSDHAQFLQSFILSDASNDLMAGVVAIARMNISSSKELSSVLQYVMKYREPQANIEAELLKTANAIASTKERQKVKHMLEIYVKKVDQTT